MVKKKKPPAQLIKGKKKLSWGVIAALAGLVVMVVSVFPVLSADDPEEPIPNAQPDPLSSIASAFAEEETILLSSSDISAILSENRTFIRHFYDPKDEMFSSLRTLDAFDSIVVERVSFASFCSSPQSQCPSSAPATLIYLHNSTGQPLFLPGVVSLSRLEGFIHGTITPQIAYTLDSCDNCSLSELVSVLSPISDVVELSFSEVSPALIINPQDLAVPGFSSLINNFYTTFQGDIELFSLNDSALVFTSNPHTLSDCANSSSLLVFFSPNSPAFEGYSSCPLDANVPNCTQVSNDSCVVIGKNPSCNFTDGQRQYLENISDLVSPRFLCLPVSEQDSEFCSNVSDINEAYALAQKHAVRSTPFYVISSGCMESIYATPFRSVSDLRTKVCAVLDC